MNSPDTRLLTGEEEFGDLADRMVRYQLTQRGIRDECVLRAMRQVPRHVFVNPSQQSAAYDDGPLPTLHGQTISQPYMVAIMTEALDVREGHKVLEVGTGSGYQTMILAMLAYRVITVERDEDLAAQAREALAKLEIDNVEVHTGDGTLGWPGAAPYDRVLVTAGAPQIPQALKDQTADGGRIVIPVGDRASQHLLVADRRGDEFVESRGLSCRFVPLVGDQGW